MGTDYVCGCRYSMGRWFLCREHEDELIKNLKPPKHDDACIDSNVDKELYECICD